MHVEGLDTIDNHILEVIKDNARLTYSEIGEQVGVSRVSVKKRMDAMEASGVIQGYQTILDPSKAVDGVRFFIDLEVTPEYYEEVVERLSAKRMIRQIYQVTGEGRLHAEGYAINSKNLQILVNALYREYRGIKKIGCHTVLSTIKDVDGGISYVRCEKDQYMEERRE